MTDPDRLRSLVEKLSGGEVRDTAGFRLLPADDAEAAISSILAEVDETILGRRLRFDTKGGTVIEAEARNARLLCITAISRPNGTAVLEPHLTAELSHLDENALIRLGNALREAVTDAGTLRVIVSPLERTSDSTGIGMSPAKLRELWLPPSDKDMADGVKRNASVFIEFAADRVVRQSGNPEAADMLLEFARDNWPSFEESQFLSVVMADDSAIVLLANGETGLAAIVDRETAFRLPDLWHRSTNL